MDTGCSREDLLRTMGDRDGWMVKESQRTPCCQCDLMRNYMYLPNPSTLAACVTRSIFQAEVNRFEFSDFLLLDWLP